MDPEVTAKEQFLMEQARVQEEMDRRSAMDAALRDLEFRGARSGGAEIAALTGAQQITSQNRMLQDLGTQAGAVDRSMQAMEGYGRTADRMRTASFDEDFKRGTAADEISMWNKEALADYNMWRDEFTQTERDRSVDRDAPTAIGSPSRSRDICVCQCLAAAAKPCRRVSVTGGCCSSSPSSLTSAHSTILIRQAVRPTPTFGWRTGRPPNRATASQLTARSSP
jgi:hypothetical protein